ncbi:hypothetical protein B484DRAFT_463188 [Ochromonadaceae sp. CCMP2298]|nr:hypothetical protein B484DRAFT_463188 [Ochromonadaceae sp. CCMP2298]
MTGNISNKVLEATELEPTYRAVEDRVDPLGLLLLLEKVCTKNSINNVEALRTEWQNLTYSDGMCIFAYINRFDALVKNIDRASGTGEKVRDCDKVYRLRQAIPESTARVLLVTAFAHEKGDKEYPSYDWCKRVATNFYKDKSTVNHNEEDDNSTGNAFAVRQSNSSNPRGGKHQRTDGRNEPGKSQNNTEQRRPNIKPTDFCTTCGKSSDVHITAGRAYRVEVDPYAVGEDDPQPIEGNYLANWTGRCSVAAKHEEPDESEVDYTPDTPESESQEDEVREEQSQEAEAEATTTNTTSIPTPAILPDSDSATAPAPSPTHTLTFNGRQWTMAELEALTAQQNDKNASRLRAAGWGVLNSRAPTPPTLSPPLPQAPAILETETTLAHPEEGAAESSASPAPVLPEETPAPASEHVPQAEPEVPPAPAPLEVNMDSEKQTPSADTPKAKSRKDNRDKRNKNPQPYLRPVCPPLRQHPPRPQHYPHSSLPRLPGAPPLGSE